MDHMVTDSRINPALETLQQPIHDAAIDISDMMEMLYKDMDSLIRQADTKAQIFMGISAIIAATIANIPVSYGQQLLDATAPFLLRVSVLLSLIIIALIMGAVFFALRATSPRVRMEGSQGNMFFFGHIASLMRKDYINQFLQLNQQNMKADMLGQVHARAIIAGVKFRLVGRAGQCLMAAVALWGLSRLLLAFAG